jgi:hypothetical protein
VFPLFGKAFLDVGQPDLEWDTFHVKQFAELVEMVAFLLEKVGHHVHLAPVEAIGNVLLVLPNRHSERELVLKKFFHKENLSDAPLPIDGNKFRPVVGEVIFQKGHLFFAANEVFFHRYEYNFSVK